MLDQVRFRRVLFASVSIKEKELCEPVRAALELSFAAIGKKTFSETGATKGLGEPLKALIPQGLEIIFRYLNLKPDIIGYVETNRGKEIFTAEVKLGGLKVQDIYQAKMYREVYRATFGFLIGTQPVTEELKRLVRSLPNILHSSGDYTFNFLALARFDLESSTFTDWFASYGQGTDPFSHLEGLSF